MQPKLTPLAEASGDAEGTLSPDQYFIAKDRGGLKAKKGPQIKKVKFLSPLREYQQVNSCVTQSKLEKIIKQANKEVYSSKSKITRNRSIRFHSFGAQQ